jgi:hypothetical protein
VIASDLQAGSLFWNLTTVADPISKEAFLVVLGQ